MLDKLKLVTLLVSGPFAAAKVNSNAKVTVAQGTLQGNANSDHFSFYGIPYAKPPTGSLRWQQPQNPNNWSGTKSVNSSDVAGCPQDPEHPTAPKTISEDCLFLNVYMPKIGSRAPSSNFPVMVWIHGGSWKHGHGAAPLYDGRVFAQSDVIVVSINYRLGAFGFLYDTHKSDHVVGNQAVWDMLKALEWVNANIDQFYGDKNKVTIFGESAGAQSVSSLMSLIEKNGRTDLFQQVIVQSNPFGIPYKNTNQAQSETNSFMQELGCTDWNCGRSASVQEILTAQKATRGLHDTDLISSAFEAWTPVLDNELLDMHPIDAMRAGRGSSKNIMLGHTTGEGIVFVYAIFTNQMGKIAYETAINLVFGNDGAAVLKQYPSPCRTVDPGCDARNQLSQILGSYLFDCPARHAIIPRSKSSFGSGDTFHFIFDHAIKDGIFPDDSAYEACAYASCHGAEIAFVFDSFDTLGIDARAAERSLSTRMLEYWANFAKNGNPNETPPTSAMPCWYHYSDTSSNTCNTGSAAAFESMHLHSGEFEDLIDPDVVNFHCDFWDSLNAYLKH